jgi:hypothetical protein
MCNELRVAPRQEMRDFMMGTAVPTKMEGNVVDGKRKQSVAKERNKKQPQQQVIAKSAAIRFEQSNSEYNMPPSKNLLGWHCSNCTFFHRVPGPRCDMCAELRVATRQEMRDFVMGKAVPTKMQGNVVEIASSPDEDGKPKQSVAKENNKKQPQQQVIAKSAAAAKQPTNHNDKENHFEKD